MPYDTQILSNLCRLSALLFYYSVLCNSPANNCLLLITAKTTKQQTNSTSRSLSETKSIYSTKCHQKFFINLSLISAKATKPWINPTSQSVSDKQLIPSTNFQQKMYMFIIDFSKQRKTAKISNLSQPLWQTADFLHKASAEFCICLSLISAKTTKQRKDPTSQRTASNWMGWNGQHPLRRWSSMERAELCWYFSKRVQGWVWWCTTYSVA